MRLLKAIGYVLTLRCEEADRIRAIGRREDLSAAERIGERLHTGLCKACWRARRQLELLEELTRTAREAEVAGAAPPEEGLSEQARQRILDSFQSDR